MPQTAQPTPRGQGFGLYWMRGDRVRQGYEVQIVGNKGVRVVKMELGPFAGGGPSCNSIDADLTFGVGSVVPALIVLCFRQIRIRDVQQQIFWRQMRPELHHFFRVPVVIRRRPGQDILWGVVLHVVGDGRCLAVPVSFGPQQEMCFSNPLPLTEHPFLGPTLTHNPHICEHHLHQFIDMAHPLLREAHEYAERREVRGPVGRPSAQRVHPTLGFHELHDAALALVPQQHAPVPTRFGAPVGRAAPWNRENHGNRSRFFHRADDDLLRECNTIKDPCVPAGHWDVLAWNI
mmetsp:Transcript_46597/g.76380  ORF Transcript_46597/g.76380 Transcript_46597/m.76380 type:complete len:290 (+) Transcript_46597:1683-2552(+)